MNKELVQKVLLPLGVLALLAGTLLLVKCDIDNAQRDPSGRPVQIDSSPTPPPVVNP